MDRIEVACDNGHRLKARRTLCGTTRPCPKCGVNVKIAMPPIERSPDPLSDTGVMRIIGEQDIRLNPSTQAPTPQIRACPRCEAGISMTANVCRHCQCYVGVIPDFLKRLCFGNDVQAA